MSYKLVLILFNEQLLGCSNAYSLLYMNIKLNELLYSFVQL